MSVYLKEIKMGTFRIPYSGNFPGRKLLQIHIFVAIHESFLHKIWGMASFGTAKQPLHKSFLCEIVFSTNPWKFLALRYYLDTTTTKSQNP